MTASSRSPAALPVLGVACQHDRRLVVSGRTDFHLPMELSGAVDQRQRQHAAGDDRGGDPAGLRLVQRERRIESRSAQLLGAWRVDEDCRLPSVAVHPRILNGVNRQIGRGAIRVDGTYRDYKNFYATVTDTTTGRVTDSLGRSFDLNLVENTDAVKREYAGMTTSLTYRVGRGLDTGASYTLSHAWGNVDAEAANGSGANTSSVLQYPEYKSASWNNPAGDLAVDQRHRMNLWAIYALPFAHGVTVSALQQAASGIPYAAVGTVNSTPFVTNPAMSRRVAAASPTTSVRATPIGRRQPTAPTSRRTTRSR